MRTIPEIASALFNATQYADQDVWIIGDVTAAEADTLATYAFGAYERDAGQVELMNDDVELAGRRAIQKMDG